MSKDEVTDAGQLPASFNTQGLKPNADAILTAAMARGKITTNEIARCIPKAVEHDRARMQETIRWLHELMRIRDVVLVVDKDVDAHQERYPIAPSEEKIFVKVSQSQGRASKEVDQEALKCLDETRRENKYGTLSFYDSQVNSFELLTEAEERELGKLILSGHDLDARNRLAEHNLRLVRWVAKQFTWSKITFEDLVAEGNVGLLKAASKFDYRKGRFSTYAIGWIRQVIMRLIKNQSYIVRVPVHAQELLGRIRKGAQELTNRTGREPTLDELSSHTQISARVIERAFLNEPHAELSLDGEAFLGETDGPTLGDATPDNRVVSQEVYVRAMEELTAARDRVNTMLRAVASEAGISTRNIDIFKTLYGFDRGGVRRTLEATGQQFDLTRERVRQIVAYIWQKVAERNNGMDHHSLLRELARIEDLEIVVAHAIS